MSKTREDLESFYQFAIARLNKGSDTPLDELLMQWYDDRDRDAIHEAIRQELEDVEAGRVYPAHEVMEELRREFGI